MRISTEHVTASGELVGHEARLEMARGISVFGWRIAPDLPSLPIQENLSGTIEIFAAPSEKQGVDVANKLSPQSRMERFGRLLQPGEPALYLASGDSIPARLTHLRDGVLDGQRVLWRYQYRIQLRARLSVPRLHRYRRVNQRFVATIAHCTTSSAIRSPNPSCCFARRRCCPRQVAGIGSRLNRPRSAGDATTTLDRRTLQKSSGSLRPQLQLRT